MDVPDNPVFSSSISAGKVSCGIHRIEVIAQAVRRRCASNSLSTFLDARFPIVRSTRVVREGQHDDALGSRSIYDRKRKVLEKNASRIPGCRQSGERKGNSPGRCLFDCCREARAKTKLFGVVVDDLSQKLTSRRCDEPGPIHRDKRRASAKTSSAA